MNSAEKRIDAIKRVLKKRSDCLEVTLALKRNAKDWPDKKYYEGKKDGYDQAIELLGESLESINIELRPYENLLNG